MLSCTASDRQETDTTGGRDKAVLYQNEPNPFRTTTVIKYYIPSEVMVYIVIYNRNKNIIAVLNNSKVKAGEHQITFTAPPEWKGTYVYEMTTDSGFKDRKTMTVY